MKWLSSFFGKTCSQEEETQLNRYRYFRQLGRAYNLELIKQLPPPALPESGKKLGLYKAGTLIINQDDEIAVAYDYSLHHYRRAGKNTIERALETSPPAADSDEMIYLSAMAGSRFSLFRVQDILPHRGAHLKDLVTDEALDLMDIGLSSAGIPGIIVAGRLLSFDGFNMSSGTLIPVPEPVFESRIRPVISKFMSATPGTKPPLAPAQSAAFEAQVIRIALHDGGEDNSFYTDMEV
jgi:hypothetical protein